MGAEQLGRWRQHFPQEGNPLCEDEDGGLGEQRSGLTEDLQLLGTIIPPGGGGGRVATQVTAGCRVPSPKPRRLDTKYHQDESAECPFLGNSWLSP